MGGSLTAIDLRLVQTFGSGLSRPECILATRSGVLFVSYLPHGVMRIQPDGRQSILGNAKRGLIPNGIALLSDGTLLVANLGEDGGVWSIDGAGDLRPYLMEVDGSKLSSANFVLAESDGSLWITNSTRKMPRDLALNVGVADGFVVRIDARGARIAADGLAFANECRVNPAGSHLYVVETTGRRVKTYPIRADGELGAVETFVQFGHGDFPDGAVFDSENHLWVTSVFSNRLYRVSPEGKASLLLEESNPDVLNVAERAREAGKLSREHLHPAESGMFRNLTSVTFGGEDLKTVFLGSIGGTALATFRSPVAGLVPAHWNVVRGN